MARPTLKQDLIEYFIAAMVMNLTGSRDFERVWNTVYEKSKDTSSWGEVVAQFSEAGRLLGLAVYDKVFKRRPYKEYDSYLTSENFVDAYIELVLAQGRLPRYGELVILAKQSVVMEDLV